MWALQAHLHRQIHPPQAHHGESGLLSQNSRKKFEEGTQILLSGLLEQIHGSDAPWKTYLVVLEGNLEEKKPKSPTKEKGGTEEKRSSAKKSSAAAAAVAPSSANSATKTSTEASVAPTEPVTLAADWASHGAITLVSHGGVGTITVIHTDVPPGTQLHPIVTASGSSSISLDGSAISVPFSIPVSVAQALSAEVPSTSLSVPTLSVPVSDALLASDISAISATSLLEAAATQTVLAPPAEQVEPKSNSGSKVLLPDIETVIVGEEVCGKEQTEVSNHGQNTEDEAESTKDQSSG